MILDLPKEMEEFVKAEASKENISECEFIQMAIARFADWRRIQNYKNDIALIRQGKLKLLSEDEVFGNVKRRLKERRENASNI